MPNPYITPATFRFFEELRENNDRDWFQANKRRYEEEVRDPLLQLVADFAPRLQKISKNFVADPRPSGGSLFRIYRDTRFAKDKSPYKTYAGITFHHADGKDLHAPGYYLHVEPGEVFMAAGMWHAESAPLKRVRDAIVAQPQRWKRVRASRGLELDENHDDLVRAPRGYDPEHPFVVDLKRRGFTASTTFTRKQATAPDFLARFAKACREKNVLMEFLCHAMGRPF